MIASSTLEQIRDGNDEHSSKEAKRQYDCYPSWTGELCDNVPNYTFCHLVERRRKSRKMESSETQHQGPLFATLTHFLIFVFCFQH